MELRVVAAARSARELEANGSQHDEGRETEEFIDLEDCVEHAHGDHASHVANEGEHANHINAKVDEADPKSASESDVYFVAFSGVDMLVPRTAGPALVVLLPLEDVEGGEHSEGRGGEEVEGVLPEGDLPHALLDAETGVQSLHELN